MSAADGTTWRVQWYSRADIGQPDRAQGFQEFDTKLAARAHYASDEVQSLVGPWLRVELQERGPWKSVESTGYRPDAAAS